MPFITAREDAGLSLSTNSQDIDAIVLANQRLAVDWVQRPDNGSSLTKLRLAGNYTCPETRKSLSVGDIRFINSSRFEISADAWMLVAPMQKNTQETVFPSMTGRNFPAATQSPGNSEDLITATECQQIFGRPISSVQLADLNSCMRRFQITTPSRMAHFLAQIAHESGGLQFMSEIWGPTDAQKRYEGNSVLGNTEPGDGSRFRGAGAIQMTGRYNYNQFARFVNDMQVMEGYKYVAEHYPFTSAGFWWHTNSVNNLVDQGATCRRISQKVNGRDPATGLADREQYFAKAMAVIGTSSHSSIASGQEQSRPPATESVRLNYDPNAPVNWNNPRCKVSRYFTVAEVTQNDPRRIPQQGSEVEENILSLAKELDKVREDWGSPIGVTSWYRPPAINAAEGGVSNSQHIYGKAADVYTMDAPDQWHPRNQEFEQWLDEVAWRNRYLGKGCASNQGFTHLDLRPGNERWNY